MTVGHAIESILGGGRGSGRGSHSRGSGCPPAGFAGFGNRGGRRDKSSRLHYDIFLRLLWTWDISGGSGYKIGREGEIACIFYIAENFVKMKLNGRADNAKAVVRG